MPTTTEETPQEGPHLILQDADGEDKTVSLTATGLSIGRRTSNDLQILDPTVSREHAKLGTDEGGYWIEDLESTHGTFVNDIRVRRQTLHHNDRIRLGKASNKTLIFRTHREFSDLMETAEEIEPTPENLRNLWALLEITKALNSTLRLDEVLEKVVEAILALTRAERGMLLLGESADNLAVRVERNFDTTDSEQIRYSSSVVADVFKMGEPRILTDAAQDEHFSGQESIVGLNLRTVMCVPLRLSHRIEASPDDDYEEEEDLELPEAADMGATQFLSSAEMKVAQELSSEAEQRIVGVIYVDRRSPTRFFTDQDLALFESFASHAAVAIDNASLYEEALEKRRLENEIEVARDIQQSLLTHEFPELDWVEVYALNEPSRQVGGDYYDVLTPSDDSLTFAVGDISGKGIPAALLMSTLQSTFVAEASAQEDLAKVCVRVNEFLVKRTTPERYATFFVGRVTPEGKLLYVNAGHNPPMILRNGEVHRLVGGGLPLGLFAGRPYEVQEWAMQPGDLLLLFTDGVTEANNAEEEEFGEERFLQVIAEHPGEDVRSLGAAVFAAIERYSEGLHSYFDDVTLLLLRLL
jgi:serine phosphatase RsbU (regulator of sigma subunit)/pSer/pThr/pTyr-binding forkhead associated (FHA) protein